MILFDLIWGSWLITSLDKIRKECETARFIVKDRFDKQGNLIKKNEKIFFVPVESFKTNKLIDKLDELNS